MISSEKIVDSSRPRDGKYTIDLTVRIVSAYLARNPLSTKELLSMLSVVNRSVSAIVVSAPRSAASTGSGRRALSAADINRSISEDWILCLEDGQRFKCLTRHLAKKYGLTPDQYRARWGLPGNYPMSAPSYARRRSDIAKESGLGRHGR